MASSYDTAQICLNGHLINALSKQDSGANQAYCDMCGERTTMTCMECSTEIRGAQLPSSDDVVHDMSPYEIPAHCYQCGARFPWTQRHLDAARILAEEFEQLTPEERNQLTMTLPDLVIVTPKTPAAELTFKRLMLKAGKCAADAMKRVLIDIVSEVVRKKLWG